MKQFHLHHLFQELSSKLVCPHCKKKIGAQDLELKSTDGNNCTFEAFCHECNNSMSINAVVETHLNSINKEDLSEKKIGNVEFTPPLNDKDVRFVKDKIYKIKTIKDLFTS